MGPMQLQRLIYTPSPIAYRSDLQLPGFWVLLLHANRLQPLRAEWSWKRFLSLELWIRFRFRFTNPEPDHSLLGPGPFPDQTGVVLHATGGTKIQVTRMRSSSPFEPAHVMAGNVPWSCKAIWQFLICFLNRN